MNLKKVILPFLVLCMFFTAGSLTAMSPFAEEDFNEAINNDKLVLLDFHASWCGTCKAQEKPLKALLSEEFFSDVVAFRVDYDNSAELKNQYNVQRQSTLVLLRGEEELSRSMGVTNKDELRSFLKKGL